MENQVFLLLGSNMGDRQAYLTQANALVEANCGRILRHSALYLSKAWGLLNQRDFYNQVLVVETQLEPPDLLAAILAIELEIGRVREQKWSARTIDIDILFYGQLIIESPGLTIPHPRLAERNFTLVALMELSPQMIHPKLAVTIEELYLQATDTLDVIMIEN